MGKGYQDKSWVFWKELFGSIISMALPVNLGSHKTVDISDRLEFPASSRQSVKEDWRVIQKELGLPCRINPHITHFSDNFKCISLMFFTSVKSNPSVLQPVKQLKVTDAEALNNQV